MTDQEMRDAILEEGYEAAKKGGSINASSIGIYEISKDWGEEKIKIWFNADYLYQKGWVIWSESAGFMRITVDGVDKYEEEHPE